MKFSFSWAHFKAPTAPQMAKLGNSLFAVSTGVAVPVLYANNKIWAGAIFAVGAIGKFLSSFFTDDDTAASIKEAEKKP